MKLSRALLLLWIWLPVAVAVEHGGVRSGSSTRGRRRRVARELQAVGRVTTLRLINSTTDVIVVDPLVNGTRVPLGSYSIEALTTGSVQSVRFGLNGNPNIQTENGAPWAMCSNSGRDFFTCNQLGSGTHTVTAMAFAQRGAAGANGGSLQVVFSIGVAPTATPPTPVRTPTKAPVPTPTKAPVPAPTKAPISAPTKAPTVAPTRAPVNPVAPPTPAPALAPTSPPLAASTKPPTQSPSKAPTRRPTKSPTKAPARAPTKSPTRPPSKAPTKSPSKAPTKAPTRSPVKLPVSPLAGRWIEVNANANIDVRHEACFVLIDTPTIGRRAYLVGGRNDNGIKDLDIYNPITRTWTKGMRPPVQLHHMQCVAAQGKLWIVAAWTGWYPKEKNADNAYVYDPITNRWQTKKALPPDRRRGSSAVVVSPDQSKIYVSHGNSGGHETANFAIALGYLDVYDIATDSWTALSSNAPNPRDHTGGAMINGKICVAGGRNGGEINWPTVAPTDCYDLATGKWQVMAPIPQVRAGSSYGVTCDGKLMVAGGEGGGKAWSNVDVFDGTNWTTLNSLIVPRHGSGLAVDCVCNQIHIASGAKSQGGGVETKSVETYFPGGVDVPCMA